LLLFLLVASFSFAKDVHLAIANELPPYIIRESSEGIEYEIVKEALEYKGHNLIPQYVPLARITRKLRNKGTDGSLTFNDSFNTDGMYLSEEYITYHNVMVTLKNKNRKIDSLSDFNDISVLGFQNSRKYLGEEYAKATETCKYFKEINNQKNQVMILLRNRVDAIVIDKNIFLYHYKGFARESRLDITIHHIFRPNHYKAVFKDKKIRDDFNEGIKYLRDTGRYDDIVRKYTN
jgi:polar amino acid transport system substrate-binding protein